MRADFRDHQMPPGTPPGPEAALKRRAKLHAAFPDFRIRIEDIVPQVDGVAMRHKLGGEYRGTPPIVPVPVTSRAFAITGIVFWRIRESKKPRVASRRPLLTEMEIARMWHPVFLGVSAIWTLHG